MHIEESKYNPKYDLPVNDLALFASEDEAAKEVQRDLILNSLYAIGGNWKTLEGNGFYHWRDAFRREIMAFEYRNDFTMPLKREKSFYNCSWKSKIHYAEYKENSDIPYAYSCGSVLCPKCFDRDKRRTAYKYLQRIMKTAKAQEIKRFWGCIITLPVSQEALIPAGSDKREECINEIKKFLRKLFGLKTKDSLFSYCNIRPLGNENLFRNRFYFHCGILPLAVRRKNKKPIFIPCDFPGFKVDLIQARALLVKHLETVFPDYTPDSTVMHLTPFRLDKSEENKQKLLNRLICDLRGFGSDIEQMPIFFEPDKKLVVINQEREGYGVYTFEQMAERWHWIREQRCMRVWGILQSWNKYKGMLKHGR